MSTRFFFENWGLGGGGGNQNIKKLNLYKIYTTPGTKHGKHYFKYVCKFLWLCVHNFLRYPVPTEAEDLKNKKNWENQR